MGDLVTAESQDEAAHRALRARWVGLRDSASAMLDGVHDTTAWQRFARRVIETIGLLRGTAEQERYYPKGAPVRPRVAATDVVRHLVQLADEGESRCEEGCNLCYAARAICRGEALVRGD